MDFFAKKLSHWLLMNEVVVAEDIGVYEYSIKCICVKGISLFMAIGLGYIFDKHYWFILLFPFLLLRRCCGGYHARCFVNCLLISGFVLMIFWSVVSNVSYNGFIFGATCCSVIQLCACSPIVSDERVIAQWEIEKNKLYARWISSVLFVVHVFLLITRKQHIAYRIALGIILTACMQFPCLLSRYKNKEW